MIDIKKYDFYNFNINDFINDWYIENDWIYWKCYFKKDNDKITIFYTNFDKNRILELFIYDKLKDWINFMKLTWLYEFCKVLNKNKIDNKRILDRNTIIQVL